MKPLYDGLIPCLGPAGEQVAVYRRIGDAHLALIGLPFEKARRGGFCAYGHRRVQIGEPI